MQIWVRSLDLALSEKALVHGVRFGEYSLALALKNLYCYIFHRIKSWCEVLNHLIDHKKISLETSSLSESDMIPRRKNSFWLVAIDSQIDTALLFVAILQKRRKELWMDYFDEMKNRSTYSAIIAKHAYGKVWNFFLNLLHFSREELFIILSTSLKFPVGQSRKF